MENKWKKWEKTKKKERDKKLIIIILKKKIKYLRVFNSSSLFMSSLKEMMRQRRSKPA